MIITISTKFNGLIVREIYAGGSVAGIIRNTFSVVYTRKGDFSYGIIAVDAKTGVADGDRNELIPLDWDIGIEGAI